MSATNADSMTNTQGEFKPSQPTDGPLLTGGHQPGKLVGNDAAPDFSAKILPAGTAPKKSTFKPNPVNEIPGQALNPDIEGATKASDTLTGATSADVHTGLGKPVAGQSEGKKGGSAATGQQGEGGSGINGDESDESRRLQRNSNQGPQSGKEFNASLDGAESKESVGAEEVAAMGQKERKQDYDRTAATAPGPNS